MFLGWLVGIVRWMVGVSVMMSVEEEVLISMSIAMVGVVRLVNGGVGGGDDGCPVKG